MADNNIKINYSAMLEAKLKEFERDNIRPSLLLHVCCAPCSSYVLEYLHDRFDITLLFYNPNISPVSEYEFRYAELMRLINECHYDDIKVLKRDYHPEEFEAIARGLENEPERGPRCYRCYRLRLDEAARECRDGGYDYFTTTLSISPHKNNEWLCEIGAEKEKEYNVRYLYSDFKKKNGYKRSIELSAIHSLYRQNYCGCVYSKQAAENRG